jgi:hypothetical protein
MRRRCASAAVGAEPSGAGTQDSVSRAGNGVFFLICQSSFSLREKEGCSKPPDYASRDFSVNIVDRNVEMIVFIHRSLSMKLGTRETGT